MRTVRNWELFFAYSVSSGPPFGAVCKSPIRQRQTIDLYSIIPFEKENRIDIYTRIKARADSPG